MAETTTTTSTAANPAGGEAQTTQQPATPTAEQRTAFQKFMDALFGGKEDPAPASGEGEGTKKGGDPAPKEGEGTKERAKAEGEAKEQELTKLRAELLQRDLKDAALKKLTDEGFPGGLADLLTYTDQESMEKSLKHTQEVFKGALEVAVKERLRGKTPEGLGGGAKVENTVKDQIAQSIRGGMM